MAERFSVTRGPPRGADIYVSPNQSFDVGPLTDKVPASMRVAAKGHEFAEIVPAKMNIHVPENQPSAIFGTPLACHPTNTGADTLVATGCFPSGCVRGTIVDGFAYNFRAMMMPQDAAFDRSEVSHAVSLFNMSESARMSYRPMTS